MTALLIDDSKFQRSLVRQMLGQLGIQVHESENGRDGIDALEPLASRTLSWST